MGEATERVILVEVGSPSRQPNQLTKRFIMTRFRWFHDGCTTIYYSDTDFYLIWYGSFPQVPILTLKAWYFLSVHTITGVTPTHYHVSKPIRYHLIRVRKVRSAIKAKHRSRRELLVCRVKTVSSKVVFIVLKKTIVGFF